MLPVDLSRRVVQQVGASHHVSDLLCVVVHDNCELIGMEPVTAAHDEISKLHLEVLTHVSEIQIRE